MEDPNCIEGIANVVYNPWYVSMQILQILTDIVTIIVVVRTRRYVTRKLVNKEAVFLINIILLAFCLHATIFSLTQIHHIIYDFIFVHDNCDLLLSNFTCMFIKIGTQCYTIFLSQMFIVQCCERTMVTFYTDRFGRYRPLLWKVATMITFLIAVFLATLVYIMDIWDPVDLPSCWMHTHASKTRVDTKYYGLIITDTIALIWMLLLYLKNRRISSSLIVSLNTKYQDRENVEITLIILICGCFYSSLIILHASPNMIRRSIGLQIVLYRVLGMFLYCLSYANLAYISVLYFLLKRKERRNKTSMEREVSATKNHALYTYFSQYKW